MKPSGNLHIGNIIISTLSCNCIPLKADTNREITYIFCIPWHCNILTLTFFNAVHIRFLETYTSIYVNETVIVLLAIICSHGLETCTCMNLAHTSQASSEDHLIWFSFLNMAFDDFAKHSYLGKFPPNIMGAVQKEWQSHTVGPTLSVWQEAPTFPRSSHNTKIRGRMRKLLWN